MADVDWSERAGEGYARLIERFWDDRRCLFRVRSGRSLPWPGRPWHYWWQAHALSVVAAADDRPRAAALLDGIRRRCAGRLAANDYYDDLGWLALALLDVREALDLPVAGDLDELWTVLRTAMDGPDGTLVWRRGDDFRNIPANGPAAIVAARRYALDGDPEDLAIAVRLVGWLHAAAVSPAGVVWDGVRPTGPDRRIFSYNQGLVIGADVALHAVTGADRLLVDATGVARAATAALTTPNGLLPDEGEGDGGLFKGIFARYAGELAARTGDRGLTDLLAGNGEAVWAVVRARGVVGPDWGRPPDGPVALSSALAGVLLLQALARLPSRPAQPVDRPSGGPSR